LTVDQQPPGEPSAPSTGVLELVLQRFPERTEQIELCYAQLPAFREICEDYAEVEQAWEAARAAPGGPPAGELRVLLEELEAELIRALDGRSVLRSAGCEN
jgi:hypothetical protein